MIRSTLALTLLLALDEAGAVQLLDATTPDTQLAKISQKEVTRIAFERSRIRKVTGNAGEFVLEKDEDQGQIYLRPTGPSTKPINLFVSSDTATINLLLQPIDGPSDSILIREPRQATEPIQATPRARRNPTHIRQLKHLLRTIATDELPDDMTVKEPNRTFTFRPNLRLTLERTWTGPTHVGEKYRIVNTDTATANHSPESLTERDFHRPGVLAVSLERTSLAKGESTTVFVIRERHPDD